MPLPPLITLSSQNLLHTAKWNNTFIPQAPQKALQLLYASMTDLPCQARTLFSDCEHTEYDLKRWTIAKNILDGLKEKLAAGELRDLYVEGKDQDIDDRDDSDESVGRPW